jgi:hypothetical protein
VDGVIHVKGILLSVVGVALLLWRQGLSLPGGFRMVTRTIQAVTWTIPDHAACHQLASSTIRPARVGTPGGCQISYLDYTTLYIDRCVDSLQHPTRVVTPEGCQIGYMGTILGVIYSCFDCEITLWKLAPTLRGGWRRLSQRGARWGGAWQCTE